MRRPDAIHSLSLCCTGNAGTREQAKQYGAFRRSLINQGSGNKGTQLCFIKGCAPLPVPTKKAAGTAHTSETSDLERPSRKTRVPMQIQKSVCEQRGHAPSLSVSRIRYVPAEHLRAPLLIPSNAERRPPKQSRTLTFGQQKNGRLPGEIK
jgi:hypothetical protein